MLDRWLVYHSNCDSADIGFYESLMTIFDSAEIGKATKSCPKGKDNTKQTAKDRNLMI